MMEQVVQVREAVAADIPSALILYRELDSTHQALDVALRVRDERGRMEHLAYAIQDGRSRFSVAVHAGRVVAFVLSSFARRRPDIIIEALTVDRPFRRSRIGTILVRDIEGWAKRRGARYVELGVYEFNPEARAFYESLGYLTASRTLRKDPTFDGVRMKR